MKQPYTRSWTFVMLICLFSGLCMTANAQQQADPEKLSEEFIWECRTGGELGPAWVESDSAPTEKEVKDAVTAVSEIDKDGIITVRQVQDQIKRMRQEHEALRQKKGKDLQHENALKKFEEKNGFLLSNSWESITENGSISVALGDLDGDRNVDAFIANTLDFDNVWINDANTSFIKGTERGIEHVKTKSLSVKLGDLDGDGDLDAVVCGHNGFIIWINSGKGTFELTGQILKANRLLMSGANWAQMDVALGDLDGDSDLDVYIANSNSQPDSVWMNDGNANFIDTLQAVGKSSSHSVALGDLDSDGDLDAFVANYDGPNTVWTNDGNGMFTNSAQTLGDSFSNSVALGDLDGDGDLDAMVANNIQPNTVWTNDGNGMFDQNSRAIKYESGQNPGGYSVVLEDLDGDGDKDAIVANFFEPSSILINNGQGIFTGSEVVLKRYDKRQSGDSPWMSVASNDLDGDGDPDIFFSGLGGELSVWLNH